VPEVEEVSLGGVSEIRPAYYGPGGVYEPVNVIDAWSLSFRVGTALAYMARAGKKPGVSAIEDIQKAHTFLGMEIAKIREGGGDIAQKQNSQEAEEAGEGGKNRLNIGDTPPPRPSTRPGTPEGANIENEWIKSSGIFLAQNRKAEDLKKELGDVSLAFVTDPHQRPAVLAVWTGCLLSMPSLEWRRLLMTLPIEARREIMAANVDWFLERLDKAEGGWEKVAMDVVNGAEDGYEGMPMGGRP